MAQGWGVLVLFAVTAAAAPAGAAEYPSCVSSSQHLATWQEAARRQAACIEEVKATGRAMLRCDQYLSIAKQREAADECWRAGYYYFNNAVDTVPGYAIPADVKRFLDAGAAATKELDAGDAFLVQTGL